MTAAHLEHVRTAAAVAALMLAVLSHGDALVLAALLAVMAWRLPALAVLPALVASSWRWGSTSLEAWAGAQAVLGPAGSVGPVAAAAGSWLAALAIALSGPTDVGGMGGPVRAPGAPNLRSGRLAARVGGMTGPVRAPGTPNLTTDRLVALVGGRGGPSRTPGAPNLVLSGLAVGAAAADVVAGPAAGGDLWIRVVAIVVATLAAVGVSRLRADRRTVTRGLDVLAVLAAAGAVAAVTRAAPGWAGTIDGQALVQGLVIAVAAAALVTVGGWTRAAMRQRGA